MPASATRDAVELASNAPTMAPEGANDPMSTTLDPVLRFHEHLNAGDAHAVMALATEDVAVGGPRGSGEGRQLLYEWVGRASIALRPVRWFAGDDLVIVEQIAEWRNGDGEMASSQRLATAFRLREGRISGIYRYGNIGEALTTSGLDEDNEIPAPDARGASA